MNVTRNTPSDQEISAPAGAIMGAQQNSAGPRKRANANGVPTSIRTTGEEASVTILADPSAPVTGARKKLDPVMVEGMRQDWESGMRQVDIAAKYGVSQSVVSRKISGSPKEHVSEIRRLKAAIRGYFLNGYSSQQARERALWAVVAGDD